MPTGYSGTPLPAKLGIKDGGRVLLIGAPRAYATVLRPLPRGVEFATRAGPNVDVVQLFVTKREALGKRLAELRKKLRPDAAVWVSWPKKSSGVATTITEDTIREVAFPFGFVDIKVCAVTEAWSGLKLVVRKELR